MRWRAHGGVPSESAFVGMSDQSDATIRAGKLCRPLDRILAILDVGVVIAEVFAIGDVAPSHVLRDEDVSARRPISTGGMQNARVRGSLEHDTERTIADRSRDVAHEARAVAGLHE